MKHLASSTRYVEVPVHAMMPCSASQPWHGVEMSGQLDSTATFFLWKTQVLNWSWVGPKASLTLCRRVNC